METQEYLMQLQMLEQEANQFGEQIKVINQQVGEMQKLNEGVDGLKASGEEEIFSELGKGIFLKSKMLKSDFLIDVGAKVLVPKTSDEVKGIISEQIDKLNKAKDEISKRIEEINAELNKIIGESHKKEKKKS